MLFSWSGVGNFSKSLVSRRVRRAWHWKTLNFYRNSKSTSLQASSPSMLRFFAHKQICVWHISIVTLRYQANEKFGVLSIKQQFRCSAREGPAWKRSQLASEKQDSRLHLTFWDLKRFGMFLWESRCRDCGLSRYHLSAIRSWGDFSNPQGNELSLHSIPITLMWDDASFFCRWV